MLGLELESSAAAVPRVPIALWQRSSERNHPIPQSLTSIRQSLGFTLVELLVAIMMFMVLMSATSYLFISALRSARQGNMANEAFETSRGAIKTIEDDLSTGFTARQRGGKFDFYGAPYGMVFTGVLPQKGDGTTGANQATLGRISYVMYHGAGTRANSATIPNDLYTAGSMGNGPETIEKIDVPLFNIIRYVEVAAPDSGLVNIKLAAVMDQTLKDSNFADAPDVKNVRTLLAHTDPTTGSDSTLNSQMPSAVYEQAYRCVKLANPELTLAPQIEALITADLLDEMETSFKCDLWLHMLGGGGPYAFFDRDDNLIWTSDPRYHWLAPDAWDTAVMDGSGKPGQWINKGKTYDPNDADRHGNNRNWLEPEDYFLLRNMTLYKKITDSPNAVDIVPALFIPQEFFSGTQFNLDPSSSTALFEPAIPDVTNPDVPYPEITDQRLLDRLGRIKPRARYLFKYLEINRQSNMSTQGADGHPVSQQPHCFWNSAWSYRSRREAQQGSQWTYSPALGVARFGPDAIDHPLPQVICVDFDVIIAADFPAVPTFVKQYVREIEVPAGSQYDAAK